MPVVPATRDVDVAGEDLIEVEGTARCQQQLWPLLRRRPDDGPRLERRAHVLPMIDRTGRCEIWAGGHRVGELPDPLAAELHTGLLALALLDPPHVVAMPLTLELRERRGGPQVAATAWLDLDGLRLLAS